MAGQAVAPGAIGGSKLSAHGFKRSFRTGAAHIATGQANSYDCYTVALTSEKRLADDNPLPRRNHGAE